MIYEFDRYIGRQLMAEGVRIEMASSEEDARAKARRMYAGGAKPGEIERTTFVLRHREPC